MIEVDLNSPIPIEEQIRGGFHQLLLKGQLKPGDVLPEPDQLAAMLHVNPAMVSRAYKSLHQEGFLEGSVVSSQARGNVSRDLAEVVQELFIALDAVRKEGLTWEEIESVVQILSTEDVVSAEKIIPAVFKRLYFDWKVGQKQISLCPYCRESVKEGTVSCLLCKTLHHRDCWEETGHCSVFGCKGKVKLKK
jgi:DNA-binding transcriptional regulator YhcF (GntR family)